VTSFSGKLADVGDVGGTVYPSKELMLLKDCVSVIRFSNTCSARNPTEEIESCGEKCANLCRVYKLIMVSRVPGYGQLEYLEVDILLISSLYLMKLLGY
jgi:hypothetical protein